MSKTIEIVVPCYNEEDNIPHIIKQIRESTKYLKYGIQICFVDDGSTDSSYKVISRFIKRKNHIRVIKLSRNFGKEAAITVALNLCKADAAILIDADLQHPPTLIPTMIAEWEKGAQIVDAVKTVRQKQHPSKKLAVSLFYRLMKTLTNMDLEGASDFKLLDKKAIDLFNSITEKNRFFRGLTTWLGLEHSTVEFCPNDRNFGSSKWTWFNLFRLSIDAITSYTSKPLHLVTCSGLFVLLLSIVLGIQTLYNKIYGNAVSGFTTVILIILIMASIIMISIGVIGLYISKIYDEVKNRPIYIIQELREYSEKSSENQSL